MNRQLATTLRSLSGKGITIAKDQLISVISLHPGRTGVDLAQAVADLLTSADSFGAGSRELTKMLPLARDPSLLVGLAVVEKPIDELCDLVEDADVDLMVYAKRLHRNCYSVTV